jgi:hypothetical protein
MGEPAGPDLQPLAAAGAFGFSLFLAKAPDVETAKIARLTINIFFMLQAPMVEKMICAVEHNSSTARVFQPGVFAAPYDAPHHASALLECFKTALPQQDFRGDIAILDLARKFRLNPLRVGFFDRLGEFGFWAYDDIELFPDLARDRGPTRADLAHIDQLFAGPLA